MLHSGIHCSSIPPSSLCITATKDQLSETPTWDQEDWMGSFHPTSTHCLPTLHTNTALSILWFEWALAKHTFTGKPQQPPLQQAQLTQLLMDALQQCPSHPLLLWFTKASLTKSRSSQQLQFHQLQGNSLLWQWEVVLSGTISCWDHEKATCASRVMWTPYKQYITCYLKVIFPKL